MSDQEYELKLTLTPTALEELAKAPLLATIAKQPKATMLRSVYFDTPDFSLRKKGLVLRIRHDGTRSVQTVKLDGGSVGRGEWEAEIAGDQPDAAAADGSPVGAILAKRKIRNELLPLFTVEIARRSYLLQRGEAAVEIVLDKGSVRCDEGQQEICETELELKRGRPQTLFELASEVGATVPAQISFVSKGDRGYRLLSGTGASPCKSPSFVLRSGMGTGESVRAIGHGCLAVLLDNLGLLLATRDVEALHQSRVSVRRLRAVWSLFKPLLEGDPPDELRSEMKWLSDLLGAARDLDVFLDDVLRPAAETQPDAPGFEALRSGFQAQRDRAYDGLFEGLSSQRFFQLGLALARRFEGDPWAADPGDVAAVRRDQPVEDYLQNALGRRFGSVLKTGRDLETLSPGERHRVRIKAKKLRYMVEPFRSIAGGTAVKPILKQLHIMQDALGALNDVGVGREMLIQFARETLSDDATDRSALFAAGLVAAGGARNESQLLSAAQKAHDRLADLRPFWER